MYSVARRSCRTPPDSRFTCAATALGLERTRIGLELRHRTNPISRRWYLDDDAPSTAAPLSTSWRLHDEGNWCRDC